ncbi:hypothetical protein GQ42DRAFT_154916 [Ramicandelaber brevisporus]|nr:hypothetical protein GQ42DRAFT_154916 [Ramicandelaber brevisporus]
MVETRRRRKPAQPARAVSSAHYVGYVEDGESVEAIMKKFEELERIQKEAAAAAAEAAKKKEAEAVAAAAAAASAEPVDSVASEISSAGPASSFGVSADTEQSDGMLSTEQLEEVFKRTSMFSIKSTTANRIDQEIFEDDLLDLAMMADDDAFWEDVDYNDDEMDDNLDIDDDELWKDDDDIEYIIAPHSKASLRREKAAAAALTIAPRRKAQQKDASGNVIDKEKQRQIERESIIQKYKYLQVKMQDKLGNTFLVKRKVAATDPSAPSYIRIPPEPIPASWVNHMQPMPPRNRIQRTAPATGNITTKSAETPASEAVVDRRYFECTLPELNVSELGRKFQAVYIDPPFLLPGESPDTPGRITVEQFASLPIRELVSGSGFLFIWVEKELIPDLCLVCENKWLFKYVENVCWIRMHPNNTFVRDPSTYFARSKLSLLIFRKDGDIDLRHQRNPDCVFDFMKPATTANTSATGTKPLFMYDMIETMLPSAAINKNNAEPNRMLELWATRGSSRRGWTTVAHVEKQAQD